MAKQVINVGAADDDGSGDKIRVAFQKANGNSDELYAVLAAALAGAWTVYTPSVAPVSGSGMTLTSAAGAYFKIGKLVVARGQVVINSNGTGATALDIGIPSTAKGGVAVGFNASVGDLIGGSISSGAAVATCFRAGGTYPAGGGHVIRFIAVYEEA